MATPAEIVPWRGIGVEGFLSPFNGEIQSFYEPPVPLICPVPPGLPVPVIPTVLPGNAGAVIAPVERLAQYLKGVPPAPGLPTSKVRALLGAFVNRFVEVGQAIQSIQTARNWTALASGRYTYLLNQIGKLVGAVRPPNASDAQYVCYVKATIAANQSSGSIEDLYAIATLILPPEIQLKVIEYAPASFVLQLTDPVGYLGANGADWTEPFALAAGGDGLGTGPFGQGNPGSAAVSALAYFLRRARPTAVWAVVAYTLAADSTIFALDQAGGGPGLDVGLFRGWQQ